MSIQTLILEGDCIKVRIYFEKGLLGHIELSAFKEVKKVREAVRLSAFPAKSIITNRLHDLLIIEHKYIEDGKEVFAEYFLLRIIR